MYIDINGIKLHYIIEGEGENLLFLHGWGASIESFAPVISALKTKRRVIAVDFAGFGKSADPPDTYTIYDYEQLICDFLKAINVESTDIICHSFGGRVSILLGARHRELCKKIVFVDGAGIRKKRTLKYYFKVYSFKLLKKMANNKLLKKMAGAFVDVDNKIKSAGSSDYKDLSDSMKKVFVRVVNEDLTKYLGDIKSPSLLIWGRQDTDTPVYFGQIMEKKIKDAGLVVLENAGHYSYLDQYTQFMAIVNNFLGVDKL